MSRPDAAPPGTARPELLPGPLGERVQLLVAEYAGALAPARVVAVAEAAAVALRSLGVAGEDFLSAWTDATRRHLTDQLVQELVSARRAAPSRSGTAAGLR